MVVLQSYSGTLKGIKLYVCAMHTKAQRLKGGIKTPSYVTTCMISWFVFPQKEKVTKILTRVVISEW